MALLAVGADSSRYDPMDATTNITGIGGGGGAVVETEFWYHNTAIVARRFPPTVSTATRG